MAASQNEVQLTESEAGIILNAIGAFGMSHAQLANSLGIPETILSSWLSSVSVPDVSMREQILRLALEIGVDILMVLFLNAQSEYRHVSWEYAAQRKRAIDAERLLTHQSIETMSASEWAGFLQNLEAGRENVWVSSGFWQAKFGGVLPEEVRNALHDLVRCAEVGITAVDITRIKLQLPDVGIGTLSEILALRFPMRYWILSAKTREYLSADGKDIRDSIPTGRRSDPGEQYMAAGGPIATLQTKLASYTSQPDKIDFLEVERFIRWAVRRLKGEDMWEGRIREILRESASPRRLKVRRVAQDSARQYLVVRLGAMTTEDISNFLQLLNTDLSEPDRPNVDNRFGVTIMSKNRLLMQSNAEAFNRWSVKIWQAEDDEVDNVLNAFWKANDLPGAGTTFPTMLLYLRDPERYSIWLSVTQTALELLGELSPGRFRTADGYRRYNDAARRFIDRFAIPPEALDLVLALLAKKALSTPAGEESAIQDEQREVPTLLVERYSIDRLVADTFLSNDFLKEVTALLFDKRQIIFYGPPGTGKTFVARKLAQYLIDLGTSAEEDTSIERGSIVLTQLHPSYAYEDFVEGIRPAMVERPDGGRDVSYHVRDGIFKRLCREAIDNPTRRYVLILDEINRADVARVFGELLYLLEYRKESVTLPYSNDRFAIPENLFLIGTMNSADRSIALLDIALRRRFHFLKLEPNAEALLKFHEKHKTGMAWTADLLQALNRRLHDDGRDWHYHIGHSHFMNSALNDQHLRYIWSYTIVPTLEEYFHKNHELLAGYELERLKLGIEPMATL